MLRSKGLIKPEGGTIIEATSGNTGMGLALACIQKGYKLICTMSDKQSQRENRCSKSYGCYCLYMPNKCCS